MTLPTKAFLLCAGFGTRFRPQTNFIPKPALPFFNLPQALYPASVLKDFGVKNFYYNSHHLPDVLDAHLEPFLNRKSIYEKELLDSAGGIANAKAYLDDQDHFWVANGDSFLSCKDSSLLAKAYEFHIQNKALATLIGMKKPASVKSGLCHTDGRLTEISTSENALHFVGLYIFSKEIFKHIKPIKSHIFRDTLLKPNLIKDTYVFDTQDKLTWYETGNEKDFIQAHISEAKQILKSQNQSAVAKAHKNWTPSQTDKLVSHFLKTKVWGQSLSLTHESDFVCIPDELSTPPSQIKNSCLLKNINYPENLIVKDQILVDPSQWAKL